MNCGGAGSLDDRPSPQPSTASRERDGVGVSLARLSCRNPRLPRLRRASAARSAARVPCLHHRAPADRQPGAGHQGARDRPVVQRPSGDRLRAWLQMDRDTFYDETRIAIVPMGLCYPGRLPNGGDAPPRPECAPLWRERLLALMPEIRLTLLVGTYALTHVLGRGAMTERVRDFRAHLPRYFAAAASVLAHHRVGTAQSVVRRGGTAGVAPGSRRRARCESLRGAQRRSNLDRERFLARHRRHNAASREQYQPRRRDAHTPT